MKVAPSILSADFGHLADQIELVNTSRADMIHCDVMDGVFVPNISFGCPVLKAVSQHASKPLDVHLMIVDPGRYVNAVRDVGAAIMNVHYEACTHLHRTVEAIRQAGMRPAVTLNPATPVEMLTDIIGEIDMVLLMSVNPGFGGQKFIERTEDKIRRLRRLIADSGSKAMIEIDGGINAETGARCAAAGADILVAGSYIFEADDPRAAIATLADIDT